MANWYTPPPKSAAAVCDPRCYGGEIDYTAMQVGEDVTVPGYALEGWKTFQAETCPKCGATGLRRERAGYNEAELVHAENFSASGNQAGVVKCTVPALGLYRVSGRVATNTRTGGGGGGLHDDLQGGEGLF